MIEFELIKSSLDYQGCDTLMFTSKQAVYYAQELDKNWINYPVIAIGAVTKEVAQSFGANVIYNPDNYYGKELADGVLKHFKDRKMLYIRPKVISFDSKEYLSAHGVSIKEEIIYKTKCKEHKDTKLVDGAIVIFTSPSTIKCFFKNFKWQDDYKAVVIGTSTLDKLPTGVKAEVADIATIASCIKKAKSL
jgi:uroporphyrinogen-III synthase